MKEPYIRECPLGLPPLFCREDIKFRCRYTAVWVKEQNENLEDQLKMNDDILLALLISEQREDPGAPQQGFLFTRVLNHFCGLYLQIYRSVCWAWRTRPPPQTDSSNGLKRSISNIWNKAAFLGSQVARLLSAISPKSALFLPRSLLVLHFLQAAFFLLPPLPTPTLQTLVSTSWLVHRPLVSRRPPRIVVHKIHGLPWPHPTLRKQVIRYHIGFLIVLL